MIKDIINIKDTKWIIFTFLFFFLFVNSCVGKAGKENLIGKIKFDNPRYFALIKNVETSGKHVYGKDEVIYFTDDNSNYFKILGIKENLILGMNEEGSIVSLTGGNYLSNREKLFFIKGIKVDKIRFSYVYGNYSESEFKFSEFNNNSLWLSRSYKPTVNNYSLDRELIKQVKVEESNDNEVIIDKKSIQPIIKIGQKVIGNMIKKRKFNLEKEDKHQTVNLTLSNSAAKIVVGSSGILVKRFFLEKLPKRIDLQQGDFIKRINKKPINSLRDVYYVLKNIKTNKRVTTVEMDLIRDYKIMTKYYKIR